MNLGEPLERTWAFIDRVVDTGRVRSNMRAKSVDLLSEKFKVHPEHDVGCRGGGG